MDRSDGRKPSRRMRGLFAPGVGGKPGVAPPPQRDKKERDPIGSLFFVWAIEQTWGPIENGAALAP